MSEDEMFMCIFCGVATFAGFMGLILPLCTVHSWRRPKYPALIVFTAVAVAMFILDYVLRHWASYDVRDSVTYRIFYMLMGAACLAILRPIFGILGTHYRDDVVERGNPAAAILLGGFLMAATAAFAGANIGDGPGWWVVVFCALISGAALLIVWVCLDVACRIADAVNIDRDTASATRAAGLLLACGAVFGRAVAGNWVSVPATTADFLRVATPVLILVVIDGGVHRFLGPTPETPRPMLLTGLIPAALYLLAAAFYIERLGPW